MSGSGSHTGGPHDLSGVDPLLLPLANNGGTTQTNADRATSPGKARIPSTGGCNNAGITVDQRGYARGRSGCDVGAYQFGASSETGSAIRK